MVLRRPNMHAAARCEKVETLGEVGNIAGGGEDDKSDGAALRHVDAI